MYYLRTKAATDAIKFTVDKSKMLADNLYDSMKIFVYFTRNSQIIGQ
jgi:hypothetical protein